MGGPRPPADLPPLPPPPPDYGDQAIREAAAKGKALTAGGTRRKSFLVGSQTEGAMRSYNMGPKSLLGT